MKKVTAAIAALALFFSATASGPEPTAFNALLNPSDAKVVKSAKVGKMVSNAFAKKFSSATDLTWTKNQGLYFGYFKQEDKQFAAAYTYDGELFAIVRQLRLTELPEAVSLKLKEKYGDCTITDNVSEITIDGETSYYISVENKASSKLVKFLPEGHSEVVKKTKKKVLVGRVM